jgi:hypothetical protein
MIIIILFLIKLFTTMFKNGIEISEEIEFIQKEEEEEDEEDDDDDDDDDDDEDER